MPRRVLDESMGRAALPFFIRFLAATVSSMSSA
jgi:hypothetical protein